MLQLRNPPNLEGQVPRYKFKWARGGEAARHTVPKLSRAIRVGPNEGGEMWGGHPGV